MVVHTGNPDIWEMEAGGPRLETVSREPDPTNKDCEGEAPTKTWTMSGPEAGVRWEYSWGEGGEREAKQWVSMVANGKYEAEKMGRILFNVFPSLWWTQETGLEKGQLCEVPWGSRGWESKHWWGRWRPRRLGKALSSCQHLPFISCWTYFPLFFLFRFLFVLDMVTYSLG